jgi:hypothetical protein
VYARLSETYDAAESVPTQLEWGTDHATRRAWTVADTFKDDGYFGLKEITRDGFGELIAAIEAASPPSVMTDRDCPRPRRRRCVPTRAGARETVDGRAVTGRHRAGGAAHRVAAGSGHR